MARACNQAISRGESVAFTPSERDGCEGFFCALIPGGSHCWPVSAPGARRDVYGQ